MSIFEYIAIAILVVFFIYGLKAGILTSGLNLIILLLALVFAYFYFDEIHSKISNWMGFAISSHYLLYIAIIVVMLGVGWIGLAGINILLPPSSSKSVFSRVSGGICGLISGVIIMALFFLLLGVDEDSDTVGAGMVYGDDTGAGGALLIPMFAMIPPIANVIPSSVLSSSQGKPFCPTQ